MIKTITPEQQRLVIEKLYRSDDALASAEKFNQVYGQKLGYKTMPLTDFTRLMKKTEFLSLDIERFTKEVTGDTIDLESL